MLIEVRAFGLNRAESFTRIGQSPMVKLPRVLGIECVGTVVSDPSGELAAGQRVAAMISGMGRVFDGSYSEYSGVRDFGGADRACRAHATAWPMLVSGSRKA